MPPPRWSTRATAALAIAATVLIAVLGVNGSRHRSTRGDQVWADGLESLDRALATLESSLALRDTTGARGAFRDARGEFKRIEGLLYFYSPILTALINSPRIDDDDAPVPLPLATPIGFQTIEAALFDGDPTLDSAKQETAGMRWVVGQFQILASHIRASDTALIEAARVELARVTTLGLAGFDAGSSGDALREAAEAIEGVRIQVAAVKAPDSLLRTADQALGSAAAELRGGGDFETFNRLRFISGFAEPAARAIGGLRQVLHTSVPGQRSPWRAEAASPFGEGAFDPAGYAPAHARIPTPELVALGERLFFDRRLSGTGTHSCASCHDPARAFVDGRARARPLRGVSGPPLRNTPTLLNAAFEPTLFADGRARSFETQAAVVLSSGAEMASSPDLAASRIGTDTSYQRAFARAMPDRGDSAITGLAIQEALGAYERTLTALNSRFDRAVGGDTLALSAEERAGFTVFLGKGRCGTCHFTPLFNGVQPPDFKVSEPEIIGVTADTNFSAPRIDPDPGRGMVELNEVTMFAFKVPTLRNIALTAPYMHNGAFPTLEKVIDFYDAGGGAGLGAKVQNPTLAADSLHLTKGERKSLVSFLRSLTDTSFMRATAPKR